MPLHLDAHLRRGFDIRATALGALAVDVVAKIENRRAHVDWTTGWHTAVDVGLYAFGPGSERLRGVHDNDALGRAVAALLGLHFPRTVGGDAGRGRRAP